MFGYAEGGGPPGSNIWTNFERPRLALLCDSDPVTPIEERSGKRLREHLRLAETSGSALQQA